MFYNIENIEDLSECDLREFKETLDSDQTVDTDDAQQLVSAIIGQFGKDQTSAESIEGRDYVLSILRHILVAACTSSGKTRYLTSCLIKRS